MSGGARGGLAERVMPAAAFLSCLAHGDGGDVDLLDTLRRLTAEELLALIVVQAALIDPDSPAPSLAVLRQVGHLIDGSVGSPLLSDRKLAGTVRDMAKALTAHRHTNSGVHDLLYSEVKGRARDMYERGTTCKEIARVLGVEERSVFRWVK